MSYKLLGTRVRVEDLAEFKGKCERLGVTQASVINHLLKQWNALGDAYALVVPGAVGLALLNLMDVCTPPIGLKDAHESEGMEEVPELETPEPLSIYTQARAVFEPERVRVPA